MSLGKYSKTARGFGRIDFNDHYGEPCSVQQSSLATENCLWVGLEHEKTYPATGEKLGARMHLNREKAAALVEVLQDWLSRDENL